MHILRYFGWALLASTTAWAARKPANSVLLTDVQTLTLRADKKTTARRVSAISQMTCIGGSGKGLYDVDVMRCKNSGSDYDDVQWTCQAALPPEFKLGSTDVICEGYSSPDDPYILKGSCGVEYRLVLTEAGEQKFGRRPEGPEAGETGKTTPVQSLIFWAFAAFIAFVIVKGAWSAFGGGNHRWPRDPPGGGWGGGGPGDDSDDPPPPYTPDVPPKAGSSFSARPTAPQPWRPGFFSGAAAGAAAGYVAGNRGFNRGADPQVGSSRQAASRESGSSASPSSSRYESTGFGGTTRR